MMYLCSESMLALTADQNLYLWPIAERNVQPDLNAPSILIASSVAMFRTFYPNPAMAVLTTDGRVLIPLLLGGELEDITPIIHRALEGVCGIINGNLITDIHVYQNTIIARNDTSFCSVKVQYTTGVRYEAESLEVYAHTFDDRIDLVGLGFSYAFIRTANNKLYSIGDSPHHDYPARVIDTIPRLVEFRETANIQEIIGGNFSTHTLFLMNDGSVYGCGLADGNRGPRAQVTGAANQSLFVRVEFPEGVCVTKIVTYCYQAFFITVAGECYFSDFHNDRTARPGKGLLPVLIRAFDDMRVEDVLNVSRCTMVRYDGGNYCSIPNRDAITAEYINGTAKPTLLPFDHDEHITTVARGSGCAYYITDQGHVYNTHPSSACNPSRVPFFDSNPVAVDGNTVAIPSTRSCLDD